MSGHFTIGTSIAILNPATPIHLSGWLHREKSASKIASDLELNILHLKSASSIFLISVDSLYLNDNMLQTEAGLDTLIFAGASHTHFAPALDKTKQALGKVDEEYYASVKKMLKIGIQKARENLNNINNIGYFKTRVSVNINRRRKNIYYRLNFLKWKFKIENGPNYFGKTNTDLHIIAFKDGEGKILALLWSYACHPTTWPNMNEISSDYIGAVRNSLRTQYGNIPILFFQGFSGNIRANKNSNLLKWFNLKKELFHLPKLFQPFNENEFFKWSKVLSDQIKYTIDCIKEKPIIPTFNFKQYEIPLDRLMEGEIGTIQTLKIQIVKFSSDLVLIGFSAEPVVEYIQIIKKIFKNITVVPVGCLANCYGYLPTTQMIKEGGYESNGFFSIFGYKNSFKGEVELPVVETIKRAFSDLQNI
jgi:hypothetical protein